MRTKAKAIEIIHGYEGEWVAHKTLAAELIARGEDKADIYVTLRDLFEKPTHGIESKKERHSDNPKKTPEHRFRLKMGDGPSLEDRIVGVLKMYDGDFVSSRTVFQEVKKTSPDVEQKEFEEAFLNVYRTNTNVAGLMQLRYVSESEEESIRKIKGYIMSIVEAGAGNPVSEDSLRAALRILSRKNVDQAIYELFEEPPANMEVTLHYYVENNRQQRTRHFRLKTEEAQLVKETPLPPDAASYYEEDGVQKTKKHE